MDKHLRFTQNQRSGNQGVPQPLKPKAFAARFSDLSGPTNPSGILSPAYLTLKQALDRNDEPDNVLQALYDWLSQKDIMPTQVDSILSLPSMDAALDALVGLIGGKLKPQALPPAVRNTLERAIGRLAQHEGEKLRYQSTLAQGQGEMIKRRFGGGESAAQIVRRLLQ